MCKVLRPGQIVDVGDELRGVIVDPNGLDIPDGEVAVWLGKVAPNGSLQIVTVLTENVVVSKGEPQVFR